MRPLLALSSLVLAGCLVPGAPLLDRPGEAFSTLACGGDLPASPCLHLATPAGGPANEVTLAIDPNHADRLVGGAKDYRLGEDHRCVLINVWGGVYLSGDGGRTWSDGLLPGYPGEEPPTSNPLRGYTCMTDPVAVFSPDGTVYYSGLAYGRSFSPDLEETTNPKGWNIFVAASKDGGRTWPQVAVLAEGDGGAVVHDKQWFAVDPTDPQYLYMTWSLYASAGLRPGSPAPGVPPGVVAQSAGNVLVLSRSSDGGRTWTPPQALTPPTQNANSYSMPAVDREGVVHVTWFDHRDNGLYYVRSADRGETFTAPRWVRDLGLAPDALENSEFRVGPIPVLALDASAGARDGWLYVAYPDFTGSDANILVIRSEDSGATWSEPTRIDDAPRGDQFMPWITVGPDGVVHAAWMDRRDDAGDKLVGAYYARSLDGLAWGPNLRLATPFDGDLSTHQRGEPFLGDYIGLAASGDRAVALFPATYDGTAQAYAAIVLR